MSFYKHKKNMYNNPHSVSNLIKDVDPGYPGPTKITVLYIVVLSLKYALNKQGEKKICFKK